MKTNNDTNQHPIGSQGRANEAGKGDNPLQIADTIKQMTILSNKRREFMRKYGLQYGSFDHLLRISNRWLELGEGCSIYWLAEGKAGLMTICSLVIRGLFARRLLEVVGKGHGGCNLYAPTRQALSDLVGYDVSSVNIAC